MSEPPKSEYYENYWETGKDWSPSGGRISAEEERLFESYLKPGRVCIDYGCGDASRYGAKLIAQKIDYRGFDVSEAAIQTADQHGIKLGKLSPEGRTFLPDNSCDVAICFEVLEHLLEPDRAISELARVLKPGGFLIASVPNAGFFSTRLEFLATGFLNPGGSPLTSRRTPWRDPHIRFYNRRLFRRLLEVGGFQIRQALSEPFAFTNLPYLYRKKSLYGALVFLSKPFGWLGLVWPGVFSCRIFLAAQRT